MDYEKASTRLPVPKSPTHLLEAMRIILTALPRTLSVEVTPAGITVERAVADDEPVVPPSVVTLCSGLAEPHVGFETLITKITLTPLSVQIGAPELHLLASAFRTLTDQALSVVALYTRAGDWLDAFMGYDKGTLHNDKGSTLFGVPVIFDPDVEPGQLIVVGSPTSAVSDATVGVIVHLGGSQ